jgi:hypothetical protein
MGLLESSLQVVKIATAMANPELLQAATRANIEALDLSTKNLELHKQAGELETRVKELEAQLALVGEVFSEGDLVFREGELRGYCSRCWDVEHKLVQHSQDRERERTGRGKRVSRMQELLLARTRSEPADEVAGEISASGSRCLVFFAVVVVFAFLVVFFALLVFLVVLLTLSTSEIASGSSNRSRRISSSGIARSRKKRTSSRRTRELSVCAIRKDCLPVAPSPQLPRNATSHYLLLNGQILMEEATP